MNQATNFDEDDFKVEATAEQLQTISALIFAQIELETKIENAENNVKDLKKKLADVQQKLLPDAFFSAGLSEFKTLQGDKVVIKEDLSVSVPKDKLDAIVKWLEEKGHEDIITGRISVSMPKNSHNEKQAAIQALVDAGFEPTEEMTVNTMTLKKILKQHLAKGDAIDLNDFGAFAWKKSEIKRA